MDNLLPIYIVVEDVLSEAVLLKLLYETRMNYNFTVLGKTGKDYIDRRIRNFNEAAQGIPCILLRDLDNEDCAPTLLNKCLPTPKHKNLLFILP